MRQLIQQRQVIGATYTLFLGNPMTQLAPGSDAHDGNDAEHTEDSRGDDYE
jgi:hypothetical protein